MSKFQEDMIFKDVAEEDARLLIDIMGIKSKKVKIMTTELRQLDPTTFIPDIILELDDEIRIIELQSVKVGRKHHQRFFIYLAISVYKFDDIGKEVNLSVFTTAEESKKITYSINKDNDFTYEVISLADYDSEEIINTIKDKIKNNVEITRKELLLFSLVPIIEKTGHVENYVEYVVNTLIDLKGLTPSIKALAYGIEWLIVDKFVKDEQTRNILCDLLGERMSLIHEYGKNKENKGFSRGISRGISRGVSRTEERIVRNLLDAGNSPQKIANETKIPLSRVNAIKRKYHL